jgi:uncharacterized protein (UPF0333 family)
MRNKFKILLAAIIIFLIPFIVIILYAQQQSGTPSTIRVLTDANGSLIVASAAQSSPISQPIVFSNTRLKTDSNGSLVVVPFLTAGGGTTQYYPNGVIYWENPAVITTVGSTTWVTSTAYPLAAGTLATNGDSLRIEVEVTLGTAAAENKNLACNLGYSAFSTTTGVFTGGLTFISESSASNSGTLSWHARSWITRLSATSQSSHWWTNWEGATTTQSAAYSNASTLTWANAMNLLCAVGNITAMNTQTLKLQEVRVYWDPR